MWFLNAGIVSVYKLAVIELDQIALYVNTHLSVSKQTIHFYQMV